MRLPDFKAMYADIAKGLGGRIACSECGHEREITEQEAAGFLARGWPKCCGYTMSHEAAKESRHG
jgi:hypothetical protein